MNPATRTATRTRRPFVAEAVGLVLVVAWLVWVFTSAAINGKTVGLNSTFVVAPVVLVIGVVLGRLAALVDAGRLGRAEEASGEACGEGQSPGREDQSSGRWWLDFGLLFLVVALLPGVGLQLGVGRPPLGYANADTAAAVQVVALVGMALLGGTRDRWGRGLLGVAAVAVVFSVVYHGSQAGIAVAVPVMIIGVAMLIRPARRVDWAVVLGVSALGAATLGLIVLTLLDSWPGVVQRGLSSVRHELWRAALGLWREHPIVGAGPGSYVEVNPHADEASLVAAHSSLLQVLAELGLVGGMLLGLMVLVGFWLVSSGRPPLGVLAATAWTALWVHSLIDHLFDFPVLVLLAGAVLGWGSDFGVHRRRW